MRALLLASVLLPFGLFVSGCSSSRVFQTSGSSVPVLAISDVVVSLPSGTLDKDAQAIYNANSMSGAIRSAIMNELRRKGKRAATGATIKFSVTEFRLRSGVDVFWVGVLAGDDYLSGDVTVSEGDSVLKTFQASAKDSESAWSGMATGRISASRRADLFCRLIARKIVDKL